MKKRDIFVAPSILSGDFGHLADEAKRVEQAGADAIHVDIMDGHFVPNLTLGPRALTAINRATPLFLDVHIMVYNPYDWVERLVESGADRITFHFEATEEVEEILAYIRRCNIQAGLALCPETPIDFAIKYLTQCDLLLLMTVSPGFGGQSFMPEVLEKVRFVRESCQQMRLGANTPFLIEVDGGIDAETAPLCVEAGANVLVSGSYLFQKAKTLTEGVQILHACGKSSSIG